MNTPRRGQSRTTPAPAPSVGKVYAVRAVVPDDAIAALDAKIAELVAEDPDAGVVFARWGAAGTEADGGGRRR